MAIPCKVVTVSALPAKITAISMTAIPETCEVPCGVSVRVTWRNDGGSIGTLEPAITVNGKMTGQPNVTLAPGASITREFLVPPISIPGTYTICPVPN